MDQRVLVVEDEQEIAELVALHLRDLGCEVEVCHDGRQGLERALGGNGNGGGGDGGGGDAPFDLLVLDLMLPGVDGLEICRRLRAAERYTPVLMLTARSTETDRVVGLEMGADDYLTKPFSIRELVARVKAIFRRVEALRGDGPNGDGEDAPLHVGELTIDPEKRKVVLAGEEVHLTAKEFDLLHLFASRPGRVYTRRELLEQVWGYGYDGYEHTVNSHINRLRGKIEEDPSNPTRVETVWGVGYRFREATEDDDAT